MDTKLKNFLIEKIKNNNIKISIVGLGYVGLPLCLLFAKKITTFGIDKSISKISNFKKNIDLNKQSSVKDFIKAKKVFFSSKFDLIKESQAIIVCLPTPIDTNHKPDLKILREAIVNIAKKIVRNSIIIFESTGYPGLVEEFCIPIIENYSGMEWKKDFFVGYSPERVNPNDKVHTIDKINKLVSGDCHLTGLFIQSLYRKIISPRKVILVSSIKVAEAAKVIENTQRDINIGLMNEVAIICNKLNIDTKEVLDAAATKWNFIKFSPGLVGGHCIGVDPYYLKFKSKIIGYQPRIISSGRSVNDGMADYIVKIINNKIKKKNKKINILFLGVAFKENCLDIRNSKNAEVINKIIKKKKFNVHVYDPLVNYLELKKEYKINLIKKNKLLTKYEVIVALCAHKEITKDLNYFLKKLNYNKGYLFDIKSIFNKQQLVKNKINFWRL